MDFIGRVKQSRERTNPTFPLPTVSKCIRYAITEAAEYDDAQLRLEAPDHIRNNARNNDPRREWGQAGYMLASAWIQCDYEFYTAPLPPLINAADGGYCDAVADFAYALKWSLAGARNQKSLQVALDSWCCLCHAYEWDIEDLIEETCAAFEAKHANRATVAASAHVSGQE